MHGWEFKVKSGRKMTGLEWAYILREHPERASECDWTALDGPAWHCLLCRQPQFSVHCDWHFASEWDGRSGTWYWATLLGEQPQFADKCAWSKFDETDLVWMLRHQPNLVDYMDVGRQSGKVQALIIEECPSAAARCCFDMFTGKDWSDFLRGLKTVSDEILAKCKWDVLQGRDWADLLSVKKNYAQYCDWSKLDKSDWQELLARAPEFRDELYRHSNISYDDLHVEEWEPF